MPALACVVTNQSCLVKQRRAVSDLNLVGGVSARGYEGAGAGKECQCQFSHVHLLSVKAPSSQWEAPTANVSTKGTVPKQLALVIDMNRTLDGTVRAKTFPIGNVASEPSSRLSSLVRACAAIGMAEINKLSVGKVLDKLRSNDAPKKSKIMQLDEKVETISEEIQRLRAATRRLKPGQRAGTTGRG
jgi:hypothetical protein